MLSNEKAIRVNMRLDSANKKSQDSLLPPLFNSNLRKNASCENLEQFNSGGDDDKGTLKYLSNIP